MNVKITGMFLLGFLVGLTAPFSLVAGALVGLSYVGIKYLYKGAV